MQGSVTDTFATGGSFTAANADSLSVAINGSGWLWPCHFASTGSETFTIASGSVTSISGTALDGGSPAVGDRILIKDAPASTGTGSAFSSQPANGIYSVTANTTNLTVSRVYEMSASPPNPYYPGATTVSVMGGTVNAGQSFVVTTPSNPGSAFTYGTNAIQWKATGYIIGTGLTLSGTTLALSSTSQTDLALAATSVQAISGSVLTLTGTTIGLASMSTGQALIGNAGTPTITTLSGDISLGATGTVTIGAGAVTTSKMANLSSFSVLGNNTGSPTAPSALAITSSGGASAITLTDGNSNLTVNGIIPAVATTATAAGTTTLTVASKPYQQFTGTTTQTVVLPNATTLAVGQHFYVLNRSTGTVTVQTNGGATLQTMTGGTQAEFVVISTGTSAGTWDTSYTITGLNGAVTSVTGTNANGFTVSSTGGATPAISVGTSITGLLKGNGTSVSAAVAATDYAPVTTGTSILKANGAGGFSNAVSSTDYAPATTGSLALAGNGSGGFQNATLTMVGTPTANFAMGGFTLTGLATPTASGQAATWDYVNAVVQGISSKYSAVASTNTESLTITSGSVTSITGTTVDGVSPNVNDYVLIMNAPSASGAAGGTTLSTQKANGLYQVTNNTTNLSVSRAADMSGSNLPTGNFVFVSGGTTWGNGGFIVTTPSTTAAFTYGTNNIAFTQFSGAGEITAGTGISKSGNTLSVSLTGGNVIGVSGATISVNSMATGTMIFGNGGTPTIGSISGDWTIGSTGAVTIGAGAVTLAKMANLSGNSVIGNTSGSNATPAAVALTHTGAASSVVMTDVNANITANSFVPGWTTTTSSATNITLTVSSTALQQITGSTAQTLLLPTTSVLAGMSWTIISSSSAAVTVEASGGATVFTIPGVSSGSTQATFTANAATPTTAAGWDVAAGAVGLAITSGKTLTVTNTLTLSGTDSTTMTFPSSSATIVGTTATQTLTGKTMAYASNTFTGFPYDLSIMAFGAATPRAAGSAGDNPMGVKLQRAATLTSVTFRCATADASGNSTFELYRNGSAISSTGTTVSAANQVAGGTTTFSQACSAGDIITVVCTAVGTTPGSGLTADITGSF